MGCCCEFYLDKARVILGTGSTYTSDRIYKVPSARYTTILLSPSLCPSLCPSLSLECPPCGYLFAPSWPTNSNLRRSTALITLSSEDLIVVLSKLLSILGPRVEMVLDCNSASNTLTLPDAPELLECRRAVDAGLVDAGGLQNVVCAAIRGDGTLLLSSRAGVVGAVGFDDVVLDQRVAGPTVEGDVGVDVLGVPSSSVVYDAVAAWVPALVGVSLDADCVRFWCNTLPATKLPTFCHETSYYEVSVL